MIRELGEEGFKQHKKDNFARGHRLHRFFVCRLFYFSNVFLDAVYLVNFNKQNCLNLVQCLSFN